MMAPGIGDLPAQALAHVLLTVTAHDDLLRHVSLCARVHPEWRRAVLDSAAYGRSIGHARHRALRAISRVLRSPDGVLQCYLGDCDAGALALAAALKARRAPLPWRAVDLSGRALSARGMAAILAGLRRGCSFDNRGLERLDVSYNYALGDEGASALAAALPYLPELTELNVSSCVCRDSGMAALVAALSSTCIRRLECCNNAIGAKGWAALGAGLGRLSHLTHLNASLNDGMGNAGAKSLAAGLPQAPVLEELVVNECEIGDVGAAALAEAVPRCARLKVLGVRGDDYIGPMGQAELQAAANVSEVTLTLHA